MAIPTRTGWLARAPTATRPSSLRPSYHVTPDVMLYALYSEGFRLGGENSQRAAASGQVQQVYGPDTLQNYEAGIKSEWFDHRLQLNASLFFMEWDDIQLHLRHGRLVERGQPSTAERRSRKASSSTVSGTRPTGSTSIGVSSSRARSSRRMSIVPNTDPPVVYLAKRARRCRCRQRRSTGSRSSTRFRTSVVERRLLDPLQLTRTRARPGTGSPQLGPMTSRA